MIQSITLVAPDDWHCHLRDDPYLSTTVAMQAKQFKRAIVMPNLSTPVTTVNAANAYYERIKSYVHEGSSFEPLMTLYLTNDSTPALIHEAKSSQRVIACKLYPANVTTLSQQGVTDIRALYKTFDAMQKAGLPLLIHGEVNDPDVDIFDREKVFIDKHLSTLIQSFPDLKIVLEHITTKIAVDFIKSSSKNVGATITPHHLYANRNHLLSGGIKPHYYCLPILKRLEDQRALIQAATSGDPHFFIGTDSAPHAQDKKESACGCAGIFHTHAMALYAHIFESNDALDKLENFTSHFGAEFYGLSPNTTTITLEKRTCLVPSTIPFGQEQVLPFLAGETLEWEQINLWSTI